MPWYSRILGAINTALPALAPTQAVNLALLVSAILAKRTLCLSDLARAYPTPSERRTPAPKHGLLHRLKRLWRFLENGRIDPLRLQAALVPYTLASLGRPRGVGLIIDWTMFDTVLPSGERIRYQVLRIAIPRGGRAIPVLQLAYDRDHLPDDASQNQLEERALQAVIAARPPAVRPVILADRGFARATLFEWLGARRLDYVIRIDKGTCVTAATGQRLKLGREGTQPGEQRWLPAVAYGLYHGRPRALLVNVAVSWRLPKHQRRTRRRPAPKEPWYLATSLPSLGRAVAWYRQRFWIEESFKDSKSRFGLAKVQVRCPERLSRLLLGLTLALAWLTLLALPEVGVVPRAWRAAITPRGRVSLISLALVWLDHHRSVPPAALPQPG